MIFRGKTHEQRMAENAVTVDMWRRRDAPKIARIEAQWRAECAWHPWFAWFPVEVGDGQTAWLETVERRLRWLDKPTIIASWQIMGYIYRKFPLEGAVSGK